MGDDDLRKQAADAIRDALRKGGPYILLFFVSQEAGRVVKQDQTTMKLVLEAAPEIKNRYGIVINQVPHGVAKRLQNEENKNKFVTKLFIGINKDRRCAPQNITYILENPALKSEDDVLINPEELKNLEGTKFLDFVYSAVPIVQLTRDAAKDIDISKYADTEKEVEYLQRKLETDRKFYEEQLNLMRMSLEKAQQDQNREREMDRVRWNAQADELKEILEKTQKKVKRLERESKRRSEIDQEVAEQAKLKRQLDRHAYQTKMRQNAKESNRRQQSSSCIVM